jgi:hypothetical protein
MTEVVFWATAAGPTNEDARIAAEATLIVVLMAGLLTLV